MWRFVVFIFLAVGCLRSEQPCETDSDCFVGERCASVCEPAPVSQRPGAVNVTASGKFAGAALAFDDFGQLAFVSYFDSGDWTFSEWKEGAWSNSVILTDAVVHPIGQTELVRDTLGGWHFSYVSERGDLRIVTRESSGNWTDRVVVESEGDEFVYGNSLSTGRGGRLNLCYAFGDFFKARTAEAPAKAFFGVQTGDDWEHFELDLPTGRVPTFGCSLSTNSDASAAVMALTFVDEGLNLSARVVSTFTELAVVEPTYLPIPIDGRIASSRSSVFASGVPASVAYVRQTTDADEILEFLTQDESLWRTQRVARAPGGTTFAEVGLFADLNDPSRTFFAYSTSDQGYQFGWSTPQRLSIQKPSLPEDAVFIQGIPDGDGLFYFVYADGDGSVFFAQERAGAGALR